MPPRFVVVAPTFNHASAIDGVLRLLEASGLPIIVVNDGATDETEAVLLGWKSAQVEEGTRQVLGHTHNRGKAAALRTGFAEALRRGYTHAVTIDTDGQHDPTDLPGLLRAAQAHPSAIVIGARSHEDVRLPRASWIGRAVSNHLVWLESGVLVTDSQSGMRVYPLTKLDLIGASAERYGYETEILTRAGWRGVPVIETPIRCIYDVPGGRTTHFRIGRDSMSAAAMHALLIVRALLPGPGRVDTGDECKTGTLPRRLGMWFSPRRVWRMARGNAADRERLAASVGTGLLMATLPIYGVKTGACLWLCGRFRLHPLVVVSTSSLSTPPVGFVFIALSVCVGHLLLRGEWIGMDALGAVHGSVWMVMKTFAMDWIVGSVIAGTGLGALGYGIVRLMLGRIQGAEALAPEADRE